MIKIVTDSTADIPPNIAKQLDITVVPAYIVFGRETYRDGVDLTKDQFYHKLASSPELPSTAAPSIGEYEAIYDRLAEESDAIVSIQLIGTLSAIHNSASVAAANVAVATGTRIEVIDSSQVTMGYGWMAIAAAEAASQGQGVDEIVSLVNSMKPRAHVLAVLDTLEFVHRGGRVGWAQALLGTLLRVKPMIDVWGGDVKLVERTRTMDRALARLVERLRAIGPLERAIVLHADAPSLAEQLADHLQAIYPHWERMITRAGVTIAAHAGPGAVGIACVACH